jgi:hypothetical protein
MRLDDLSRPSCWKHAKNKPTFARIQHGFQTSQSIFRHVHSGNSSEEPDSSLLHREAAGSKLSLCIRTGPLTKDACNHYDCKNKQDALEDSTGLVHILNS